MIVYFRLLKESFSFAMNALRNNKLRTLLSLLGVTIGIFSIIAVLAAVDSLDRKIKKDLSTLDKNTIYLMRFSFGPSEIPQWKREQFPNVKYDEYEYLKSSMNNTKEMCYQMFTASQSLKYEANIVSDVNVFPVSHEIIDILRRLYGDNNDSMTPVIVIKPEKGIDMEAYKAELTQKLRNYRGMKTGEIDNFFINVLSGFTDLLDGIISKMNIVGWIISCFSLLVGGFGIANIMFVSVKERTNLIGIQKSLGAKNRFILFQFLFEAVILSVIGGLIGLILVWIISIILTNALDFEFVLGVGNIILGTGLAAVIGLISGILPAISASKLDPVEAIRTGM